MRNLKLIILAIVTLVILVIASFASANLYLGDGIRIGKQTMWPGGIWISKKASTGSYFLLESGDSLLLETGDKLLLE